MLHWTLANGSWWKWLKIIALSLELNERKEKIRRWSSYWSPSSSSMAARLKGLALLPRASTRSRDDLGG